MKRRRTGGSASGCEPIREDDRAKRESDAPRPLRDDPNREGNLPAADAKLNLIEQELRLDGLLTDEKEAEKFMEDMGFRP